MSLELKVNKEKAEKAPVQLQAMLKNCRSIQILNAMLMETSIMVKDLEKVARVLDFLAGQYQEFTDTLKKEGILESELVPAVGNGIETESKPKEPIRLEVS